YRGIVGIRYQKGGFQAGTGVTAVAAQDRVFGEELRTAGYATLRADAAYSFARGRVLHGITARIENATNELSRNHLNYLKEQPPEIGRTSKVVYTVGF